MKSKPSVVDLTVSLTVAKQSGLAISTAGDKVEANIGLAEDVQRVHHSAIWGQVLRSHIVAMQDGINDPIRARVNRPGFCF